MKGKIKTIVAKKYKDRDFYEVTVDLGDDKSRKYSCWQNHGKDLKEGQEIEFTEESKEYTDNEGMTRTNWKMILPGGSERKPWGGKSPEEQKKISKMAALKAAVDFLKGTEASLEAVLIVADDFHAWIEKK
jgi:hypothetical protein